MNPVAEVAEGRVLPGGLRHAVDFRGRWVSTDEASKGAVDADAECVVVTPGKFEQSLEAVTPDTLVI